MSNLTIPVHTPWDTDPIPEHISTISAVRRQEINEEYKASLRGKTRKERRHEWRKHLAKCFKEGGECLIFLDLRHKPRMIGMELDKKLATGEITRRQYFNRIQTRCANLYTAGLNTYGLATIDITSRRYRDLTENAAIEGLHAFRRIDPADDTLFCRAAAKMWHRFVETVHAEYGLPSVAGMRGTLREESSAEQHILRTNDFETTMTRQERIDLRREAGLEDTP